MPRKNCLIITVRAPARHLRQMPPRTLAGATALDSRNRSSHRRVGVRRCNGAPDRGGEAGRPARPAGELRNSASCRHPPLPANVDHHHLGSRQPPRASPPRVRSGADSRRGGRHDPQPVNVPIAAQVGPGPIRRQSFRASARTPPSAAARLGPLRCHRSDHPARRRHHHRCVHGHRRWSTPAKPPRRGCDRCGGCDETLILFRGRGPPRRLVTPLGRDSGPEGRRRSRGIHRRSQNSDTGLVGRILFGLNARRARHRPNAQCAYRQSAQCPRSFQRAMPPHSDTLDPRPVRTVANPPNKRMVAAAANPDSDGHPSRSIGVTAVARTSNTPLRTTCFHETGASELPPKHLHGTSRPDRIVTISTPVNAARNPNARTPPHPGARRSRSAVAISLAGTATDSQTGRGSPRSANPSTVPCRSESLTMAAHANTADNATARTLLTLLLPDPLSEGVCPRAFLGGHQ